MGNFCKRLLTAILGGVIANVIINKVEKIVDKYVDDYEKRHIPEEERFHVDRNGNIWLKDDDCKVE